MSDAAQRVLLLNPPGRRVYVRDYYCSKVSKSNYLFHPVDLLMLSGILGNSFPLHVIDAIADRLSVDACLERIDRLRPTVVISLIGSVSLNEDLSFLRQLSDKGLRVLVTGDTCRENPVEWLEENLFIEAVIIDFTATDLLGYLSAGATGPGIAARKKTFPSQQASETTRKFRVTPRHELFDSPNYRFPFVRHRSFATVLTDYGCPYPCSFCVMTTLNHRFRPPDDIIGELRMLKRLGRREIFFATQTFGSDRSMAMELCRSMVSERFGFGWVCFSRVDCVDSELLQAMKQAGCHTIIFGVESASEDILRSYRKGYTREQISGAFRLTHRMGLRTVATFILGLPEESEETAAETIAFLKLLECDFVSFNVAVPREGTDLHRQAVAAGLFDRGTRTTDQSGSTIAMPSHHLTRERIFQLRNSAIRDFYLRPAYLLRRLIGIRSLYELREQLYEGTVLLRETFRRNSGEPD